MSTMETQLDDILGASAARRMERAVARGVMSGWILPPDLLFAPREGELSSSLENGRRHPVAAQWLETSFPAWAFSMVEDWAEGRFDCFEQVVFSRGEDASHRLYYYICELQRRGRWAARGRWCSTSPGFHGSRAGAIRGCLAKADAMSLISPRAAGQRLCNVPTSCDNLFGWIQTHPPGRRSPV